MFLSCTCWVIWGAVSSHRFHSPRPGAVPTLLLISVKDSGALSAGPRRLFIRWWRQVATKQSGESRVVQSLLIFTLTEPDVRLSRIRLFQASNPDLVEAILQDV